MEWKTRITEILGCKYPIIQGAFAGFGKAELAAAVSEAGAFGIITGHNFKTAELLREEIIKAKEMTKNEFGINFTLMPPKLSEDYYMDMVDVVIDEGIGTVFTSAYKGKRIGEKVHSSGVSWIHKCATMKHAIASQNHGADAVVIVGVEGTGFKNPMQNTTLINMVMANRYLDIPFIAAGGIGDAHGFLAALGMGAEAVCLGTAFMAVKECPTSNRLKEKMIKQDSFDPDLFSKIYRHEARDSGVPSMAVGLVDRVLTSKELIDAIIGESEKILKGWGFKGDRFNTVG